MFLDRFRSSKSNIEFIAIGENGARRFLEEDLLKNTDDNIYFLAGVRKDLVYENGNRAKDIDICEKNYFVIDLDLRKNFKEKYGEDCSDDDIRIFGENIANYLEEEHEYLGDFDFIIHSGNGLHIYYMGDWTSISPDDYAYGVKRIYREWDNYWGDSMYYADKSCRNLARIIRFPGSVNHKNGKTCYIVADKQGKGKLFNSLKGLAKKEKQEEVEERKKETEKRVKEYETKERMNLLISGQEYKDNKEKTTALFKKIDSIPAYLIAEIINPQYKFSKNNKNFDNLKGGYTGYYYVEELNAICNGGSRYFLYDGDVNSCWSPSIIIKNQFNYSWKEVINFFKENFKI